MIELTTYLGIELLVAALLGGLSVLAVVPFVHSRAVRLPSMNGRYGLICRKPRSRPLRCTCRR